MIADDPDTIEIGRGISAGCCEDTACRSIHLRVYNGQQDVAYHCQMTIETAQWLVKCIQAAIEHRMHSNKSLTN